MSCRRCSRLSARADRHPIEIGQADVLVTTKAIYQRKIAKIRDGYVVRHVLCGGRHKSGEQTAGNAQLLDWMTAADENTPSSRPPPTTRPYCTSPVAPRAPQGRHPCPRRRRRCTMSPAAYALDLHPDDIYWCTADPGWVTGTSYGIISPLLHGVTSVVDEAEFDAERWYRILQDQSVSVWYTAPTGIRMLIKAGAELAGTIASPSCGSSPGGRTTQSRSGLVGKRVLGLPIHDNWWQTETGGIMIANTPRSTSSPARWAAVTWGGRLHRAPERRRQHVGDRGAGRGG
ncbi:AMP-binding enzyme family protein [Mycobacterium kansasii]|uniref:AMP-binding enzyme family protein n=1 Tax=Mycobacterium kansasii TaxID=1768 RepID=A0A1V3W8S4_MYCKA|nr:AMP-binding enzyme family protein [Mycobacterium kansasii]